MSSLAAAIEARKSEDVPRPPPLGRATSLGASGGLHAAPRLHLGSKSGADPLEMCLCCLLQYRSGGPGSADNVALAASELKLQLR